MEQLSYTLSKEEVRDALYLVGMLKRYKKKVILQSIACGIIFIGSIIGIFLYPSNRFNYVVAVVMILLIVLVLGLNPKIEENTVNRAYTGVQTDLLIDEQRITVRVPQTEIEWDIEKNSVKNVLENERLFAVIYDGNRMIAIPKRSADTKQKQTALQQAMLWLKGGKTPA